MEKEFESSRIVMHISRGCLVVPLHKELLDKELRQVQDNILDRIIETKVKGLVIDVSGINIMDTVMAQNISDTLKMASLLGATAVLTGLKAGVVVSLLDLDFEFQGIRISTTQEEGILELEQLISSKIEQDYWEDER